MVNYYCVITYIILLQLIATISIWFGSIRLRKKDAILNERALQLDSIERYLDKRALELDRMEERLYIKEREYKFLEK